MEVSSCKEVISIYGIDKYSIVLKVYFLFLMIFLITFFFT